MNLKLKKIYFSPKRTITSYSLIIKSNPGSHLLVLYQRDRLRNLVIQRYKKIRFLIKINCSLHIRNNQISLAVERGQGKKIPPSFLPKKFVGSWKQT